MVETRKDQPSFESDSEKAPVLRFVSPVTASITKIETE